HAAGRGDGAGIHNDDVAAWRIAIGRDAVALDDTGRGNRAEIGDLRVAALLFCRGRNACRRARGGRSRDITFIQDEDVAMDTICSRLDAVSIAAGVDCNAPGILDGDLTVIASEARRDTSGVGAGSGD